MQKFVNLIILLCTSLIVQGCEPTVILGTSAAVVTTAVEQRKFDDVVGDTGIKTAIKCKMAQYDPVLIKDLTVTVREGKVLITGHVKTPKIKMHAIKLAWEAKGVRSVMDEIIVGHSKGFKQYAADTWITTQIKSKLLIKEDVQTVNYSFQTIDGVVYIMGIARSLEEIKLVLKAVRETEGVNEVVNYTRIS